MSAVVTDFARRITQAHKAATGSLRDAVEHAVRAGQLLAEAKAALPHGAFGGFCACLPFGETTARGYMRLARLDPANRQRVADLPLRAALLEVAVQRMVEPESTLVQPEMAPTAKRWAPTPGHWHKFITEDAAFHVVPALGYPGFFHISKFYGDPEGDSFWQGTRSAIPGTSVERRLSFLGLADPGAAAWATYERPGLSEAFGVPERLSVGRV